MPASRPKNMSDYLDRLEAVFAKKHLNLTQVTFLTQEHVGKCCSLVKMVGRCRDMYMNRPIHLHLGAAFLFFALTACDTSPGLQPLHPDAEPLGFSDHSSVGRNPQTDAAEHRDLYRAITDHGHVVSAVDREFLPADGIRENVAYFAPYPPGTIIVDPGARRLYHVMAGNRAMRYLAGVGAAGYEFSGQAVVARKANWPRWTPTPDMLRRQPGTYGPVKTGLPGGPENPLGARALYLYQNGHDTLYRIHGTPFPWTVGYPTSGGCIRLFNQDVIHLAARVETNAQVIVLPQDEADRWTHPGRS